MTAAPTVEMVKHEGGKWVLYSKDGSKVLGRFDSKEAAMKREMEIMALKKMEKPMEGARTGLAVTAAGEYVLAEGGGLLLQEDDLRRLEDDKLRALRRTFIAKRSALQQRVRDLPEAERYATSTAAELWQDIEYYNQLIRACEYELGSRYATLD